MTTSISGGFHCSCKSARRARRQREKMECLQSFVEISQPVPEKKIFEGLLPYMGMAAIFVM